MPPPRLSTLLPLLALIAPTALGHSHLGYIIINGEVYQGFDPRPEQANSPLRVGWSTGAIDDGFVAPANYSSPDIICHIEGASPPAHAPVRAGDRVHVQWNGWPLGHVGPVLSYLAPCGGLEGSESGCAGVDKRQLRWTKVDDSLPAMELVGAAGGAGGEDDGSGSDGSGSGGSGRVGVPGQRWATDVLIAANNSWQVEIPRGLRDGPYVLRHEIVALHYAAEPGGAQNYPLCVNLWVEGGDGSMELDHFDATQFYRPDDPGILLNVTAGLRSYAVPGPTLAAGATPVPYAQQNISSARADGTPVIVTRSTETVPFTAAPTPAETAEAKGGRYGRNFRG
ncbi:glycoside hydrolase family 61 protein [Thermothelomyces thermophilus ATCC 42464]|uniref:lytic cellulose monooxygenase (C4-dehydrogenating) n=1 Tax=Thermothelomyces thermophilus (strain ATCC 42464 / BCRC 31852 / DSM 1799) TaxID=573729 RepID=G2QCS9_THET4|nr:glycoside hydrolase family 61 protein [Thermothelomyces thermophilus ATCC 42464]AEO58412.1 glycoside hydrolase family 61 protein [Thermothelomyces thermophilus ATCC 42464]